ncbi:MAG TPA: TetR/AcrR family transcriptional regulator [Solirubrobacteraceae bacterium]|jgi:AcrR family transcriptional regulator
MASSEGQAALGTRERIVGSSAELFQRQGYSGTGVKQIVEAANAPFGSLYHFFPGGKQELGAETIRTSGRLYTQLFAGIALQAPDVLTAVGEFFTGAAQTLQETDYVEGCSIATVALEVASTNEVLREATAEVFSEWIEGASSYLQTGGLSEERARALALSMLSLLEGAFVFCRSLRSVEPLLAAGESAVALTRAALGEAS